MNDLLKNITLDAEEGIGFEIIQSNIGDITIRARKITEYDLIWKGYEEPIVPVGFSYVKGEWSTGFEIVSLKSNVTYIWIPVGVLPADGILGEIHNSKFGIRSSFSEEEFSYELRRQFESVKKYGGFYISKTHILEEYAPYVTKRRPIVNVDYAQAYSNANSLENSNEVKSHLLFGSEYDSAMRFVELYNVKMKVYSDVVQEWTQEGKSMRAIRTSKKFSDEREFLDTEQSDWNLGFRAALWLK